MVYFMPRELSAEEKIVRSTVGNALGVPVVQYDDGSKPGMYDLDICYDTRSWGALEVTSDTDGLARSTLSTLYKRNRDVWEPGSLRWSWGVQASAHVMVKDLEAVVEDSLAKFEAEGLRTVDDGIISDRIVRIAISGSDARDSVVGAWRSLRATGVIRVSAVESDNPAVHVYVEAGGGSWDGRADLVCDWIESFCAAPSCADNLEKLAKADGREAHLAVFARLSNELWEVWNAIDDAQDGLILPERAPQLPRPLKVVWLFSTPTRGGRSALTWSSESGWSRVPIVDDGQ
jgi:hypothetical protein